MPIRNFTNWNRRPSDRLTPIEPYRKYVFICEGANTEVWYFKELIGLRKELAIHPLIDICLWEKTEGDRDISYPKQLVAFAEAQKINPDNEFDAERDRMIIVFDGDIFEDKVKGYDAILRSLADNTWAAVTNPAFELFLLLHLEGSYEMYIKGNEEKFLTPDEDGRYGYAFRLLRDLTGMNAKKNKHIGTLAKHIHTAIAQEQYINQDIFHIKGKMSSNVGKSIARIMAERPSIA